MTAKKTPEPKPEPGKDVSQEEPYKPMAVPEPTALERLAALELRIAAAEKAISQHNRYHFGGLTG